MKTNIILDTFDDEIIELDIKNLPHYLKMGNLYETFKENINVYSFEKKYLYNVKGRNKRDVNHLIIKNY